MSSSQRSSKGKARASDADYEQSFASLNLSDYDPHAPRTDYYDPSYPSTYGSSYDQSYPGGDQNYVLTSPSSHAPQQSSSATYGSAGVYTYPTNSATSSTGEYEYQNSGTSNYSGYTTYDSASVTSSSVPSYDDRGSSSGWSDTQSYGTAASSAPSRHSRQTDVNNTIHRQAAPNQVYQLPCELSNLTGCHVVFPGDDEQGWMDHVESHLGGRFPSKLRCWFCSDQYFDAKQTSGGDVRFNFISRMQHIRHHLVYEGFRPDQMMKDGHVVQHLRDHNLIDGRTYDSIVNPTTLPPIPGNQGNQSHQSHHGHHGHHRSHRSHRDRLPQVEEDVAGESSSSRHPRRPEHHSRSDRHTSDHKKRDDRGRGSSHKKKS